ncbi:MFS transporter [Amycolatopsis sp. NPDC051045]|uniref:MFS transporter n=1 Tax=Amycolatopsis sp. NPDC051045 TaxID=3156922 RepID=UPI00343DCC61
MNGLDAAAGPLVGGVLTEYFGWEAVFFVDVPLALLAALFTRRAVRPDTPARSGRFDFAGTAWFALGAASLVHGLTLGGEGRWTSPVTVRALVVSVIAFGVVERRRAQPLLELGLFRDGGFTTLIACAAASTLTFAALVYVSLWLQTGPALGPVAAGLALAPLAVAVTGIGVGISGPAMGSAIATAAPPGRAGMAAGILTTTRQFGQTLGVAVLGIAYQAGGLAPVYAVAAG